MSIRNKSCWLKSGTMLLAFLVLDSLLTGTTNAVLHEPGFASPIENVTVPLGKEAVLDCVVYNLSTFKQAWLRVDTQTILTIQKHMITRDRRISILENDQRIWSLHIREVRENDRGWYMCQLNTDPMKSQLGYLDVLIPPDIVDRGTSPDQTLREGSSVSLTCATSGRPAPHITWRREQSEPIYLPDGTQVANFPGPVLNLTRVGRQHAGAYLCIASNGIPPIVSKRITITVEFPPVISIRNQLIGAALGSNLTLECVTEGYPKPISYWSRDTGELLPVGDIEPIRRDGAFHGVLRLHIKKVTESDYGAYKCISKNILGDTDGTIKVYPMPPPDKKNVVQRLDVIADLVSESTLYGTQDYRLQDNNTATPRYFETLFLFPIFVKALMEVLVAY